MANVECCKSADGGAKGLSPRDWRSRTFLHSLFATRHSTFYRYAAGAGGCMTVPHFLQVRSFSSAQKVSISGLSCLAMLVR